MLADLLRIYDLASLDIQGFLLQGLVLNDQLLLELPCQSGRFQRATRVLLGHHLVDGGIGIGDEEIYLRTLGVELVRGLSLQEIFDLLVLHLIEHSLEQLLELILVHDGRGHLGEGTLGELSDLLTCILEVLGQLHNQLIVFLEEQDVVPK